MVRFSPEEIFRKSLTHNGMTAYSEVVNPKLRIFNSFPTFFYSRERDVTLIQTVSRRFDVLIYSNEPLKIL
jgi:hypothetical protein